MAITYVGSAEDTYYSATQIGSRTIGVDIGTRTNGLLVVGVSSFRSDANTPDVSSITWDGTSLAKADDVLYSSGNSRYLAELWYLAAPANGSKNLVITFAATNVQVLHVTISWYDGAHQTQNEVKNTNANGSGTTDPSVDITPTVDGCVIVSQYMSEANDVLSVGSGETLLQDHDFGPQVAGSSYVIQTTAGTQTVDFTGTDSNWAMAVGAFKPAGGASLTVQDAAHAHTVDSPTLVQHYVLAVQDAAHGHAADSPTLVQHYVLAVQDALHGHAADALTLVGHVLLAVQDALHAHYADGPVMDEPGDNAVRRSLWIIRRLLLGA